MKRVYAFLPLSFFGELQSYNSEPLNGNAMLIRACATKDDGSILRSKEFLLLGNGLGTLASCAKSMLSHGVRGYVMELSQKTDERGVGYWEIQSASSSGQWHRGVQWQLAVSEETPSAEDVELECAMELIGKEGKPGQYIYLERFTGTLLELRTQTWS